MHTTLISSSSFITELTFEDGIHGLLIERVSQVGDGGQHKLLLRRLGQVKDDDLRVSGDRTDHLVDRFPCGEAAVSLEDEHR